MTLFRYIQVVSLITLILKIKKFGEKKKKEGVELTENLALALQRELTIILGSEHNSDRASLRTHLLQKLLAEMTQILKPSVAVSVSSLLFFLVKKECETFWVTLGLLRQ